MATSDWMKRHPVTFSSYQGFAPQQNQASKSKKTTKEKKTSYTEPVLSTAVSSSGYSGGSRGSGGSGGYSSLASGVMKPDISGLLAAYDAQAESAKKTAQSAYDTTRNDLLTSLKRFQEQNAQDVSNQKQSYLSEQASLEGAREQANRQNRITAASRGLGGSGLQQLAQLQTLMSQGEDISQAAGQNQKAMDALRQALQQKEDDTNSNLAKAQSTLTDALNSIDSNLAEQKAKAIFEVEQDYANTLNSLLGRGGSGGGSGGGYGSGGSDFDALVANQLDSYNKELKSLAGKTDKQVKNYVNSKYSETYGKAKTMNDVRNILGRVYTDDIGQYYSNKTNNSTYSNSKNAISSMVSGLKGQGKKKTSSKKKK